ncbi:hypothetical protein F4778DRAFT_107106 [Xylariomycetidae sp. FL2044]|nr:hypothetical protein F4778DRAFT_107106 [Xylariomycetidae sp. FL2044]
MHPKPKDILTLGYPIVSYPSPVPVQPLLSSRPPKQHPSDMFCFPEKQSPLPMTRKPASDQGGICDYLARTLQHGILFLIALILSPFGTLYPVTIESNRSVQLSLIADFILGMCVCKSAYSRNTMDERGGGSLLDSLHTHMWVFQYSETPV